MALAVYRELLRAARLAFRDDTIVLNAARAQARAAFEAPHTPSSISGSTMAALDSANADAAITNVASAADALQARLQHAREVASILRKNVVQAERVERPIAGNPSQSARTSINPLQSAKTSIDPSTSPKTSTKPAMAADATSTTQTAAKGHTISTSTSEERWRLNIRPDIERGDNSTTMAGGCGCGP